MSAKTEVASRKLPSGESYFDAYSSSFSSVAGIFQDPSRFLKLQIEPDPICVVFNFHVYVYDFIHGYMYRCIRVHICIQLYIMYTYTYTHIFMKSFIYKANERLKNE